MGETTLRTPERILGMHEERGSMAEVESSTMNVESGLLISVNIVWEASHPYSPRIEEYSSA